MALSPLRKCNAAGCRQLTRTGRCEKHAKEPRPHDHNRANSYQRGYDKRWAKVRANKLANDPLCEDCMAHSRTTAAEEVHHVLKVRIHPELRLDMGNLMSLCKACHSRRTAKGE